MSSRKGGNNYVSAPFQTDISFIFQGFDVEIENCEGFKNSIRCLLVDNILKTMNFDESSEVKKMERMC